MTKENSNELISRLQGIMDGVTTDDAIYILRDTMMEMIQAKNYQKICEHKNLKPLRAKFYHECKDCGIIVIKTGESNG